MGIQIKKFQAQTLQKAIEQVRSELGDNAIILQTESVKIPGGLGMFGRDGVEVTAAIDRKEMPQFYATVSDEKDERKATTAAVAAAAAAAAKKSSAGASAAKTPASDEGKKGLKALLRGVMPGNKADTFVDAAGATVNKKPSSAEVGAAAKALAAKTNSADRTAIESSVGQLYAMKTYIEPLQKEVEALKAKLNPVSGGPKKLGRIKDPLELEIQELRSELTNYMNEKRFDAGKLPHYYRQLQNFWNSKGVGTKHVQTFFKAMEDFGNTFDSTTSSDEAAQAVSMALEGAINEADVTQKRGPRIVVLVGSTGVGKTTTLAKLAAYEKLRLKKKVALITADDFKIGGTDQISHYARILEVNFIKSRPDISLEDQCKVLEADTIYIDTFGASAKDLDRIALLKKMLSFEDEEMKSRLEVHLVLPVGIAATDVQDQLTAFGDLKPNYLLFTKWDETENWGGMLSTILSSQKPVSFICHGQNVPDDMTLFSKRSFIETVIMGRN